MTSPLRLTDAEGDEWLVLDEIAGPPDLPYGRRQLVAPGHPRGILRVFVERRDSGRLTAYTLPLHPSERGNLAEVAMREQLERALQTGPDPVTGDSVTAYVARLHRGREERTDTSAYP